MIRVFLALPVGLLAMFVVVALIEALGHTLFPPSQEMKDAVALLMKQDPGARDAITAALPTMPFATYLSVVVAWIAGAGAGTWVAARIAGQMQAAYGLAIGLLVVLAAVSNMMLIPHPAWMWPAGIALPFATAFLTARAMRPVPRDQAPA